MKVPKKVKDLTGKVFGRLTVIKYISVSYVLCKCTCNKIKIVYLYNLIKGATKSCGCYSKEIKHNKAKNLINYKSKYITVIANIGSNKINGRRIWLIRCICGREFKRYCYRINTSKGCRHCSQILCQTKLHYPNWSEKKLFENLLDVLALKEIRKLQKVL